MEINRVTFTGADNSTNIDKMKEIQDKYPFVEWGILISSKEGEGRYPSDNWIKSLKDKGLNISLHMCSKYAINIMTKGDLKLKYDFFDRYQINFNFSKSVHNISNFTKLLDEYPDKSFILQYNNSNEPYIKDICNRVLSLQSANQTHILYDSSGGRGTVIQDIKDPFNGFYTGYSGGLNPDNIQGICELICVNTYGDRVWIDMESGVRTNDIFDLNKVTNVLEIVNSYRNIEII